MVVRDDVHVEQSGFSIQAVSLVAHNQGPLGCGAQARQLLDGRERLHPRAVAPAAGRSDDIAADEREAARGRNWSWWAWRRG